MSLVKPYLKSQIFYSAAHFLDTKRSQIGDPGPVYGDQWTVPVPAPEPVPEPVPDPFTGPKLVTVNRSRDPGYGCLHGFEFGPESLNFFDAVGVFLHHFEFYK